MRPSIQDSGVKIGALLGVVCRPAEDCLYMFGYGTYMGDENINGDHWPVVMLNEKEVSLVRPQISVGEAAWIKKLIEQFPGDVHEIDIHEWIAGTFVPPTRKDAKKGEAVPEEVEREKTEQPLPAPPREETIFDKLQSYARQRQHFLKAIEDAKTTIRQAEEALVVVEEKARELRVQAHAEIDAMAGVEEDDDVSPVDG